MPIGQRKIGLLDPRRFAAGEKIVTSDTVLGRHRVVEVRVVRVDRDSITVSRPYWLAADIALLPATLLRRLWAWVRRDKNAPRP